MSFTMSVSAFFTFLRHNTPDIPWNHWLVISVFSIASVLVLFVRKKTLSSYTIIVFGLSVFIALLLFDVMVFTRVCGISPHSCGFDLAAEYTRLVKGNESQRSQMLVNAIAFIPLGFFISEFFSSVKQFRIVRQIEFVSLCSFGLSLCIEFMQLALCMGVFEITDLVMNTLGGFSGASMAALGRALFSRIKSK